MDRERLQQMVDAARDGERVAVTTLCAAAVGPLHFLVVGLLGQGEDAQRVTVESFRRAVLHLDRLPDSGLFSQWIAGIAASLSVDKLRERGEEFPDHPQGSTDAGSAVPETWPGDQTRRWEVLALVRRLPAHQRVALILSAYQEFEPDQTARIAGVSAGAVAAWTAGAMASLRAELTYPPEVEPAGGIEAVGKVLRVSATEAVLPERLLERVTAAAMGEPEPAPAAQPNLEVQPNLEEAPPEKKHRSKSTVVVGVLLLTALLALGCLVLFFALLNRTPNSGSPSQAVVDTEDAGGEDEPGHAAGQGGSGAVPDRSTPEPRPGSDAAGGEWARIYRAYLSKLDWKNVAPEGADWEYFAWVHRPGDATADRIIVGIEFRDMDGDGAPEMILTEGAPFSEAYYIVYGIGANGQVELQGPAPENMDRLVGSYRHGETGEELQGVLRRESAYDLQDAGYALLDEDGRVVRSISCHVDVGGSDIHTHTVTQGERGLELYREEVPGDDTYTYNCLEIFAYTGEAMQMADILDEYLFRYLAEEGFVRQTTPNFENVGDRENGLDAVLDWLEERLDGEGA